jgi:hypothetical protein
MTVLEQILGHEVDPTIQGLVGYRLRSGCGPTGGELADYLAQTVEEFQQTMQSREPQLDTVLFGSSQQ